MSSIFKIGDIIRVNTVNMRPEEIIDYAEVLLIVDVTKHEYVFNRFDIRNGGVVKTALYYNKKFIDNHAGLPSDAEIALLKKHMLNYQLCKIIEL